jgi:hypothetical protein
VFPKLNPASAHIAAGIEIQPISMFNLRAVAEVQQYFGTFGFLQSFANPDENYSDATLDDLSEDPTREPQSSRLVRLGIQPLLQAKVGPIAIRAQLMLDRWSMNVRDGDTAAYEPTYDTLLPDGGWTITTDTDVLYTGRPKLVLGLRHTWVRPLYASEFEDSNSTNEHHRLGLFGAYTLRDTGPSMFNKPSVILILSWYLKHRYRTGEPDMLPAGGRADDYTSQAIPYLLLGFAFESDFLPVE